MKQDRKLVLYSGGQDPKNHLLHRALVDLTGGRSRKRMTYFAFCADNANLYYHRFVRRYGSHGGAGFQCLILDQPQTAATLKQALDTDAIYISGGNTFYILKHLRRLGLIGKVRQFVRDGRVLAGLSAGAVLMGPTIELAGYPSFEADENEVGLKDLRALDLVPFEFYPHFHSSARLKLALLKHSRRVEHPVYACADGDGIIIQGESFRSTGGVHVFHRGDYFRL